MAGRYRLAFALVGRHQHLLDDGYAHLDGFPGAAAFLHHHGPQLWAFGQILRTEQPAHLAALAAETDNERAGNIGMPDIAGEGALQQIHGLAGHLHSAAKRMGKCRDAVDIGEIGETLFGEVVGDLMHDGR